MKKRGRFPKLRFLLLIVDAVAVVGLCIFYALGVEDDDDRIGLLNAIPSPDRKYIVYVFAEGQDSNNTEIYIESFDGSNKIYLTNDEIYGHSPAWNSDASQIAFVGRLRDSGQEAKSWSETHRQELEAEDIYVINIDGSGLVNLTNNDVGDKSPLWSPDSRQILFRSGTNINIMASDGSNSRQVADNWSFPIEPFWSPVGNAIVFSSDEMLISLDIVTGEQTSLLQDWKGDYCLSWSPNGEMLVYRDEANQRLYTLSIANADAEEVFFSELSLRCPVWSPNGQHLAASTSTTLYMLDSDGLNIVEMGQISSPIAIFWSIDGTRVFVINSSAHIQEFKID